MSSPILFLDIDGVLNSIQYAKQVKDSSVDLIVGLDPVAVNLLDEIIERTNCDIVISSSMRRIYTIEELKVKLYKAGMLYTTAIIGATPVFNGLPRGYEVQAWLNFNSPGCVYCCVDDDSDYLIDQPLIRIDNEYGLRHVDVERAVQILSKR